MRFASGLTTMPSPPAAVSSSHQATPAGDATRSVVSTTSRRVGRGAASGRPSTSRSATARCQRGRGRGRSAPSVASTWNGASCTPVQPVGRPAVAAVGVGERVRRWRAATGCGRAGRRRRARAPARGLERRPTAAGSAARAAAPTAAYWSRSRSSALADHGSSSQSSSSQSVVQLVPQAGRGRRRRAAGRAAPR